VIFIDSNVPMYLVGDPHPHKIDAQRVLERLTVERKRMVTSSEVFQELLHRYVSIDRRDRLESAFDLLQSIVDDVLAIEESDVFGAKNLLHAHRGLSARDAVHAAVMRHHGITEILSFDSGFDALTGFDRLPRADSHS